MEIWNVGGGGNTTAPPQVLNPLFLQQSSQNEKSVLTIHSHSNEKDWLDPDLDTSSSSVLKITPPHLNSIHWSSN